MKIYENEKFIKVSLVDSPKHILYDWKKTYITLAEFKEMHLTAIEAIKANGVYNLISDSSKVTDVPQDECKEWLGTQLIPLLSQAGVKKLITIVPQTALGRLGTKSWQQKVMGIDMYDVKSMDEAISLV